jgi:predicted NBD/HSP70 family sugar kinase
MIGIELDDQRVVAVAVEGEAVRACAVVRVGETIAAAVEAALRGVNAPGHGADGPIGLASPTPESAAVASAVSALAGGHPGLAGAQVVASGAAAALAEAWIGAARGAAHVVLFAVGERASGGIVRDSALMTGARGRAASVSWLALNPVEREDYQRSGCLEAEAAAAGIVRRLVWRVKAGDASRVQDAVGDDLSAITIDHVLDAARSGDGVATSVIRDTAKYLGMAAANLVVVADPETLVLGGLIASAADLLFEAVRVEIGRRLPRPMMDALTIVPAALGDEAPAIGAARLGAAVLR